MVLTKRKQNTRLKKNLPPLHVVLITSGLGNQMFCYAYYKALRKQYPYGLFLIDSDSHIYGHYGLELFKVFHCKGICRWYLYRILKKIIPNLRESLTTIKQTNALAYESIEPILMNKDTYHIGFHQSEKYFLDVSTSIRRCFRFRVSKINPQSKSLAKKLKTCNSVSIHIRRGDYLKQFVDDMCSIRYYHQAIEHINQMVDNPHFYIFSDDLQWCKDNFNNQNNYHFVDINAGKDSWQDMYLMSQCKHNIIANSSFSWWGAWLNDNEKKIVIAPNPWFRTWSKESSFDVIPDNWIMIENN